MGFSVCHDDRIYWFILPSAVTIRSVVGGSVGMDT